jgi:hypothetical protein
MIRILVFMGLMAMSMLIASCCRIIIIPICYCGTVVVPLYQSIRESLQMVKKEFTSTIILTTEKVKRNEVDFHVGNEIIDSLSFNIPPEKIDDAKKAIEPVAQRIVRFFGDHPRQKCEAEIACSGITDGQELNAKLCELRARSVANLLVDQIRSKEEFIPNPERIRYNIKWVGQREALPYPGKRRSMISLTWNLLPASLYAGSSDH